MGIFCTLKCSTFESAKEGSKLKQFIATRDNERKDLRRRNDQLGSEFTKQLGTRRRRAQKTPLVPPVQAGFYF
jgi:hypothetical protein